MDRPINLLALDGGGIRGLSELLILREIMSRVRYDSGLAEIPRPCEYFDLIGGTSTGGLIAIMLGRLSMTIDEAIEQYTATASAIFSKKNRKAAYKGDAFKASTLENKIKELVEAKALGRRMIQESSGDDGPAEGRGQSRGCRAFVCAMPARNMAHPQRIRTYAARENAGPDCLIWEAARATTAAPTFFKPVAIAAAPGHAPQAYVDGGLRCNNPVREVMDEARAVFGGAARLGCLVSVGAGHAAVIGLARQPDAFERLLPVGLIKALKSVATDCEKEAQSVARQFREPLDKYFRFSVAHGASGISLEEWERLDEVTQHTEAYLKDTDVTRAINRLVKLLCEPNRAAEEGLQVTLDNVCGDVMTTMLIRPTVTIKPRHAVSPLFKGRQALLQQLSMYFMPRESGKHLRREFLLHGMGGAGKSQIALKFAEEYEERFTRVFWLDATNKATIEQSYKEIGLQIQGAGAEQAAVGAAHDLLASLDEEWLLIVDGADEVAALSGLWPPGRYGNVLYISRNRVLKELSPSAVCVVAEMEADEAVELLLDAARLRPASDEVTRQARSIVAELGSLALAVNQAGAFMARGECHIQDYLITFKRNRAQMLGHDAYQGASTYERAAYATWELSYAAIERRASMATQHHHDVKAAQNAIQLLHILAFFHYENVPEAIFRQAAEDRWRGYRYPRDVDPNGELAEGVNLPDDLLPLGDGRKWDARPFRLARGKLCAYSLLSVSQLTGALSMHRLVHGWCFDRLSRSSRLAYLKTSAATLASSVSFQFDADAHAFRRNLLPHVTTLFQRADVERGDAAGRAAEKERFALVFREAMRTNDAVTLWSKVFETRKRLLGEEHEVTLTTMGNLALELTIQGRLDDSEKLHRQELALTTKVLGPEHPTTLRSMGYLALVLRRQGRAAEAEKLHRQELALETKVFGPEHPTTIKCMGNLASALRRQGRAAEAEKLHRQRLALNTKVLGPEHPSTLTSMYDLALVLRDLHRNDALKLMSECYELEKAVIGAGHPRVQASLETLNRWKAQY